MGKKIVKGMQSVIGRRKFVGRLTAAAGALLAGIFSAPASAASYLCCSFCHPPSSCGGYVCSWGWYCCHTDGMLYRCVDFFDDSEYCGILSCSYIRCHELEGPLKYCS